MADADLAATAEAMTGRRASLLLALMGGQELTASELASRAELSASLASSHLARLLDSGLVRVRTEGRSRRYRLADAHVAEVLEQMLTLAPQRRVSSLREATSGAALGRARTCYDHLAGELGVALVDALVERRVIARARDGFRLTQGGRHQLEKLDIDVDALAAERRAFLRPCLDWTERRPHLAGAVGAAIADAAFATGGLVRSRSSRAVRLTDEGRIWMRDRFGLNLPAA